VTGEVLAVFAALAYAGNTVLARRYMIAHGRGARADLVAPESAALLSQLASLIVYAALIAANFGGARSGHLSPQAFALFVAGGVVGTFMGLNLIYVGVQRIGASRAASLLLTNTVFAAALGLLILRELPRPWQLAGAAVLTGGLWAVIPGREGRRERAAESSPLERAGVVVIIASAFAFAAADTLRRIALTDAPYPLLGATVGTLTALVPQAAVLRKRRLGAATIRASRRGDVWASAVLNSLGILAVFVALRHSPVTNIAALYNLQALFVILLSRWALRGDEHLSGRVIAGSVICAIGSVGVLLG
jgi:drug/metabolite transporter (DMT)-like permease